MTTPQDEMRANTLNEAARFIDVDADLIDKLGAGRLIESEKVSRVLRKHAVNVRAATAAQAEALAAAQADAASALGLLSRVRFALGDNGTRMQDELIEWCKGLNPGALAAAVQAERAKCMLAAKRGIFETPDHYLKSRDILIHNVMKSMRDAATLTPTASGAQEQA